jgi:hypothetical protein
VSPRYSSVVYRHRRLGVLAAAVTVLALVVLLSDHGPAPGPKSQRTAVSTGERPAAAAATTVVSTTAPAASTSTTVDSGNLPQTAAFPTSDSPQFSAEMAAFWGAVTSGVAANGLPSFFPEAAYEQLKTVPNPGSDWTDRLLDGFDRDIGAAHQLLGPDAASAQLVGVRVDSEAAHWVTPGTCDNRVGYFEVPNSRVVYQEDGQVRSFGIASLISWRGVWYVVHLGAVIESPGVPVVDAPAAGPGYPSPLETC